MDAAEIALRAVGGEELDRLRELAENCPGAPRWTLNTWQQVLESAANATQRIVLMAESRGECVGFGIMGMGADEAEIESLAVSPKVRRQGVGRSLCEALIAWAGEHGAGRVLLEVRLSNRAARGLYEALNFREVAVRRDYYREPDEDGLVMERAL